MTTKIARLTALEILDSRGKPTVSATCLLSDGCSGTASVPSGASTGTSEAVELRDGDAKRYAGLGCLQAVANINGLLHQVLHGRSFTQTQLDETMIELDGTANKAHLGANSLLAVSLAFARASAHSANIPLYQYFANLIGQTVHRLPRLTINLFSGGKHAGGQVGIQDVLIVPLSQQTVDESLAAAVSIYRAAAQLVEQRFSLRLLRADEGGLAPPCSTSEKMIELAVEAISLAGFVPGQDVALAIDVASTHFFQDGSYLLDGEKYDALSFVSKLKSWIELYPIISLEDGLAEDDWLNWPVLRKTIGNKSLVLGDDLLCTNPARIQRAIELDAANALLLKVNQIGTLTEAVQAYQLAKSNNWHVTISARSGETEDHWLADLAVGWSADHLKVGSVTQSDRLAKYNRLLSIAQEEIFR